MKRGTLLEIDPARPAAGLTVAELRELVASVIREEHAAAIRSDTSDSARLSLNRAARIARTRPATVQAAATSGALRASRRGTRWSLLPSDLKAWVAAGRPVTKSL